MVQIQKKYYVSRNKIYTAIKGKGKTTEEETVKPKPAALTSHSESINE